jgi:uncharacterized membrane protein HdeD (DUF308 family)
VSHRVSLRLFADLAFAWLAITIAAPTIVFGIYVFVGGIFLVV